VGVVDPQQLAQPYLEEVRGEVAALPPIRLVGLLATERPDSRSYSDTAARGCARVGIHYEARRLGSPEQVSREIWRTNRDPDVHGVIVYYPIFGGERDRSLQNEVDPEKDVEGLHGTWTRRLYNDERWVSEVEGKKAILPCTPVGVVKALESLGVYRRERGPRHQAEGLVATIFNRSEVVGRPLAALLAHDGAEVWSFDVADVMRYGRDGLEPATISRREALAASDVVVTAVPAPDFPPVRAAEIKPGATLINVSWLKNLDDDVVERAGHVLLRVGPLTVAMLLRNTLRLFRNYHAR
jgi:methylenetetrahydrofolate dehydrogenase (NADP+)/methenyltetrahydrofolate cyclohydrolase